MQHARVRPVSPDGFGVPAQTDHHCQSEGGPGQAVEGEREKTVQRTAGVAVSCYCCSELLLLQ